LVIETSLYYDARSEKHHILKGFLYYITRTASTFVLLELRLRIICRTEFKKTHLCGAPVLFYIPNKSVF